MSPRWGTQRTATTAWRKQRLHVLNRDGQVCQLRYQDICTVDATDVDHIINHATSSNDHEDNLQAACRPCHRRKTGREAAAARPQRQRPQTPHPGLI